MCRCPYYPARLLRPSLLRPGRHEHVGRPVPLLPTGMVLYVYTVYVYTGVCMMCMFVCSVYYINMHVHISYGFV